jgi:hypothetical protein
MASRQVADFQDRSHVGLSVQRPADAHIPGSLRRGRRHLARPGGGRVQLRWCRGGRRPWTCCRLLAWTRPKACRRSGKRLSMPWKNGRRTPTEAETASRTRLIQNSSVARYLRVRYMGSESGVGSRARLDLCRMLDMNLREFPSTHRDG